MVQQIKKSADTIRGAAAHDPIRHREDVGRLFSVNNSAHAHRTLVGHLKICDGSILWADEDAHTLLDYPSGALTDMPFDDVLPPASANELKLPARGAVDGRRVVLRARHGHTIMADLRGERMDDRCVLWSFTPTASRRARRAARPAVAP